MDGYEKLLQIMKNQNKTPCNIVVTTMITPTSCYFNDLKLDPEDLYISQHLKTGYQINAETFIEPLKSGDTVVVFKASEEKYVVLERVV